ncbi:MAG: sigma-70 family RNA polymerase sigma factor [Bacteroidales bacterium]
MKKDKKHTLDAHSWMDRYADYLFNYAIVRLSDPELAADAVQDTFLSALRAREQFQGNSTEKTWLTSILKRKIIDIYRKKKTAKESPMQENKEALSGNGEHGGHWQEERGPHSKSLMPEGEVENNELRLILEKCIAGLPDNMSAVFIMKMIDEAPTEEICKELDITPSNFWVMMHRARLHLRNCIELNWK